MKSLSLWKFQHDAGNLSLKEKTSEDVILTQKVRRSRSSEVCEMIRQDIIRGNLVPEQKLKIDVLCERYSVGSTPIREALSLLSAEGLVDREEQIGFSVASVRADEFEKLLSVRCLVELPAFRYAIEKGGREWEEEVMLAHYRLSRASRSEPDAEIEWEYRHKAFHMSLISACGSDVLLRLSRQLYDENSRYRYAARMKVGTRMNVAEEHQAIADAALARDADRAVALLGEHYTLTGHLLRDALNRNIEAAKSCLEQPSPGAA